MSCHQHLTRTRQAEDRMRAGAVKERDGGAGRQQRPGSPRRQQRPRQQRSAQAQPDHSPEARTEDRESGVAVEAEAGELAQQSERFGGDEQDHTRSDNAPKRLLTMGQQRVTDDAEHERKADQVHPPGERLQHQPGRRRRADLGTVRQRRVRIGAPPSDIEFKSAAGWMGVGGEDLPAHDVGAGFG